MPNNHPYDKKGDRRQQNLNDLVDGAVNFGLDISSTVLSGIAGALDSVGDSLNRAAQRPEQNSFIAYRRKLDNSLAGHYGGWMTMGVLGWVFGGCFAIAALVMAILAGAAPNDASLWSAMPVFNILAPTFTACTLGFFVMGYAGCHAANYFGRLRRYLRGMHGFTAELPELTRSSVVRADKVRKDLRNALAKGHYPNACMNEAETTLYLDETMYHPAPAAAPVQPKAAQPALTDEELFRRDGSDFLNYLKTCQGRLRDQADEELVQMRKTCAAIMGFVHNHPEQLPRVRRYREYYMPTTRKLLNTALGLGESATQNAQEIRRDIVGILHTLNTAYEKLYDTLLQDVSMDVSTEIDTLEVMLNQDGLTHDFAADFGAK